MGKPTYQDRHKNQTARIFARAFARLAAEEKWSTTILGVDLAKEGFEWHDRAVYGFQKMFPRPQIYYQLRSERAQGTRDETGRFVQRNRYGEYIADQTTYPSNISNKKEEYGKTIIWCEGDPRDSDRDSKAKKANCDENAKITAKLTWLFKDLNKFVEAIKEVVKKKGMVERFNAYCLQAALDEAENNLQEYNYAMSGQLSYNTRDLEVLFSIAPIMRWFFEVAPRIAPPSFQKTSKLLSFYAKYKQRGKEAVQDYPWFCDMDRNRRTGNSNPDIQQGMFMMDWNTLATTGEEGKLTGDAKDRPKDKKPTALTVEREPTTTDIPTTTKSPEPVSTLPSGQKWALVSASVLVLGGIAWWLWWPRRSPQL